MMCSIIPRVAMLAGLLPGLVSAGVPVTAAPGVGEAGAGKKGAPVRPGSGQPTRASSGEGSGEVDAARPRGSRARKRALRSRPVARPASRPQARGTLAGATPAAPEIPAPGQRSRKTWFHWSLLLDWSVSVAVAGAALGLAVVEPVSRTFDPEDASIGHPAREETVPSPWIAMAVGVPLAVAGLYQIGGFSGHDLHHAALGLAEAFSLTLLVTNGLKTALGRLRPDFLARCDPDQLGVCQGDPAVVSEGRRSFPSGHASLFFAGSTYLSLYLWGRLQPRGPGAFWKVPLILAPLGGAAFVAASRVRDNLHSGWDVTAGSLIGVGCAFLGYALNYHMPWSDRAGQPRFRAGESRSASITVVPSAGPGHGGLSLQGSF